MALYALAMAACVGVCLFVRLSLSVSVCFAARLSVRPLFAVCVSSPRCRTQCFRVCFLFVLRSLCSCFCKSPSVCLYVCISLSLFVFILVHLALSLPLSPSLPPPPSLCAPFSLYIWTFSMICFDDLSTRYIFDTNPLFHKVSLLSYQCIALR